MIQTKAEGLTSSIISLLYHPHILTSVKPELRYGISKALARATLARDELVPLQKKSVDSKSEEESDSRSYSDLFTKLSPSPTSIPVLSSMLTTPSKKERLKKVASQEPVDAMESLKEECYKQINKIYQENQKNYPFIVQETPETVLYSFEENMPDLKYINVGNLRGATLDKIVEWIGGQRSLEFRDLVIITYPNYTTRQDLLLRIIKRFMIPWPLAMSSKEAAEMLRERYKVIQNKILGFLQYWITEKRSDFARDKKLRITLETWIDYMKKETIYYKLNKRQIQAQILPALEKIGENTSPSKLRKMAVNFDPKDVPLPVSTISYHVLISGIGLLGFPSELIATQLALIDQKYFCSLTSADFFSHQHSTADTKSLTPIQRLNDRHNLFTLFITAYVIKELSQSSREALADKFVDIAKKSLEIGNINAAFIIYSALSCYVSRLKKTWAKVRGKHRKFIEQLDLLFSTDETYRRLREYTRTVEPPCVPCFYMWCKDMDTIKQVYKDDYLDKAKGIINIFRQAVIADRMKELAFYQKVKYNYYKVPMLYTFLEEEFKLSLALLVEPHRSLDAIHVFIPIISRLEP